VILIAPSDHWIEKEDVFLTQLKTSFEVCQSQDVLMTMGIVPTYPNTGYGYIQYQNTDETIKKVTRFTEKPDYDNAVKFVKSGNYLWNAGIFIWSSQSILSAFEKYLPQTYDLFLKGNSLYNSTSEIDFINEIYPLAENISVDYAILEKSENVMVLPVNIGWNDLGTWGALYQKLDKDSQENAVVNAQTYFSDASGNMIRTEKGKKVIVKGLHDFIVVENEGILLILPKNEEQSIKDLSRKI
jgi:mannose-1-phosphate guanylyltransferase